MTPLQVALRILVLISAIFLVFLMVWLFYCRCRRGAIEPIRTDRQVYYAIAQPHEVEDVRYPALKQRVV